MSKNMLFIYNASAGKGQIKLKLSEILDNFTKHGYEVMAHPTQSRLDAYKTVKEKGKSYDIIVCSGGDGTLNEVVKGIMESDAATDIGYIPAGTVNDFANSLGISKNMVTASRQIVTGSPFAIDIGKFNNDYFTYVAAFGAFTDVSYETPQQSKNIFGKLAYIMEGIKRLPEIKSYKIKVEYDGGEIEDEFIVGMITNSESVAGIKNLSVMDMSFNDGLFEMLLIKMPNDVFELNNIITALATQKANYNYMYCIRSNKFHITSEQELPWTIDGEYGGDKKDVNIEVINEAISIVLHNKNSKAL